MKINSNHCEDITHLFLHNSRPLIQQHKYLIIHKGMNMVAIDTDLFDTACYYYCLPLYCIAFDYCFSEQISHGLF